MRVLTSKQVSSQISTLRTHEVIDHTLFHRLENPAQNWLTFFNESAIQDGKRFTTNLEVPAMLHRGQFFIIKAIGIRSVYKNAEGQILGVCRACGAPWTSDPTCNYCGCERPSRPAKMMPPIGLFCLEIMNRRYTNGLITGPFFKANLKRLIVIPEQCFFRLTVELKDYQKVSSIHVSLLGQLGRPHQ